MGGNLEAMRRLVRMGILWEAIAADLEEQKRLERRLHRQGLPPAQARRRVRAWLRTRASWRLRDCFQNFITWDRPGGEHFYGRGPLADPAQAWSREIARELIAVGAKEFPSWP